MVFSLTKYVGIGLALLTAAYFFKEAHATSLTETLSRTGLAGQELGSGIRDTLTGVGEGSAKILNPFFTFADLVSKFQGVVGQGGGMTPERESEVGGGINVGGTGQRQSTISWSSGTSASVPLSSAARSYYRGLGVSVS